MSILLSISDVLEENKSDGKEFIATIGEIGIIIYKNGQISIMGKKHGSNNPPASLADFDIKKLIFKETDISETLEKKKYNMN